jgi:hypothetical protein
MALFGKIHKQDAIPDFINIDKELFTDITTLIFVFKYR